MPSYPDVVVLLPGIIGSVLSKDGKGLWEVAPGAIYRALFRNGLKTLELGAPDNGDEDLGDGIEATGLMSNVEILPGLWKIGGYSMLARDLIGSLDLKRGENFFEFPYDWRRDNRVAAKRLARNSHDWLKRWRDRSGNADAKLVLIAHSMGGLVARHFIENLEGWKSVRTLVSFGTPYRGAGNALNVLSNGLNIGPFQLSTATSAVRSFESVYQLLPIYPYVDDGHDALAKIKDIKILGLDQARAAAAWGFHEDIRAAAEANAALDPYRHSGTTVRPVVGIEQPTFQSATLSAGKIQMSRLHEGSDLKGDGTVSRVSAIPIDGDPNVATYVATSHAALNSVDAALAHLRGVLTGATIELDKFRRDQGGAGWIGLDVPDAFDARQPVSIAATTSARVQSLDALVERLDEQSKPLRPILMPSQGGYRSEFALGPGLYRVTIAKRNFQTVSDVFLVADPDQVAA